MLVSKGYNRDVKEACNLIEVTVANYLKYMAKSFNSDLALQLCLYHVTAVSYY